MHKTISSNWLKNQITIRTAVFFNDIFDKPNNNLEIY